MYKPEHEHIDQVFYEGESEGDNLLGKHVVASIKRVQCQDANCQSIQTVLVQGDKKYIR